MSRSGNPHQQPAAASTRERVLSELRAHRPALEAEPASQSPPRGASAPLPVRRFDWPLAERIERLERQLTAVHGEVIRVGDDWPVVLAQRLRTLGVARLGHGGAGPLAGELQARWPEPAPALVTLDRPIEDCREELFDRIDAGLTSCRGAIAETGSLVLWPTAAEPRLLSLVPPIHAVLLEAGRIVSTLHELIATEGWVTQMPTNALLISGPSKSADIEQTLAYGVHGPARLIVLLRA
jgi:L-lactate dehydrogenase complex protein LldG